MTRSTIRVKRPAVSMSRAFRDPASVSTHASPPGAYWYQIGTVSGTTALTGRHRQSRDVRLGQEEFAIAFRQAAIRHEPEPKQRY